MTNQPEPEKTDTRQNDGSFYATGEGEDPPPFFRRWKSMYMLVLGVFVGLVILFYLFTKAYA